MRDLMIDELEYVSGGRAEDSGNGNVCGGAGCGGSRLGGGGSVSRGKSNNGGGSSHGGSSAAGTWCGYFAGFGAVFTAYGGAMAADNPYVSGISFGVGSLFGTAAGVACGNMHWR